MRTHPWNFSFAAALLLLCPFDLVASLGMDLYLPAVPDLPRLLVTSPEQVQLTLSVYLVWLGAGQLILGPLADRIGRRCVLLGGSALFVLASVALAVCRAPALFLCLRALEAASGAAMLVATFATVRDVYGEHPDGARIYGTMSAVLVLVPALGPALGALLYRAGGLGAVFGVLAAGAALAGAHAALRWPETRPAGTRAVRLRDVGGVLGHAGFWRYTLGHAVAMGSFFVMLSIAPGVLGQRLGYGPVGFGLWFGTIAVVLFVAARAVQGVVARRGPAWCLPRGLMVIAAGAGLAAITATMRPTLLGFLGPAWLVAVGIALVVSVSAAGALASFGHVAGTATALFSCVASVLLVSLGSLAVLACPSTTTWPLALYAGGGAVLVLLVPWRE